MRVERLPFTVYDILGYLVPGITGLWGVLYCLKHFELFGRLKNIVMVDASQYSRWLAVILFFVISYLLGQIIGFLSSITIERLSIAYYGYPSSYVCKNWSERNNNWSRNDHIHISKDHFVKSYPLYLGFLQIALFPVMIFIFVVNRTRFIDLAIKGLPGAIIEMMEKNFEAKTESAGLVKKKIDFGKSGDWFRFVCFYVYNNYSNTAHRLYNYLTIYGFLRNMAFIFNVASWFLLISSVKINKHPNGIIQIGFDWFWFLYAIAFAVVSAILFFAFMKFYRRYTEEAILAFATYDDKLLNNKP